MIIDCIADLHGHYPELEGGDLLIVAGDLTARDQEREYLEFFGWVREQKYEQIILIGGNHDNYLMNCDHIKDLEDCGELTYLCDSGSEFEGLKIYGSPWSLTFPGINPKCTAFTGDEELLASKFALIPDDVDILVTHGPPVGILDRVKRGENVGSFSLNDSVIGRLPKGIKLPRVHIFGHIHECYGKVEGEGITFINCSHVNERYEPVNEPIRIIL